jgi:hypothetical protein
MHFYYNQMHTCIFLFTIRRTCLFLFAIRCVHVFLIYSLCSAVELSHEQLEEVISSEDLLVASEVEVPHRLRPSSALHLHDALLSCKPSDAVIE